MVLVTRRSTALLLVCSFTLAAGCSFFGSKDTTPAGPQAVIPAPAFLPPDRVVDKWDNCDKVHFYNASTLYITLGPDAPQYTKYHVQELIQTKYRVGLEGLERLDVQVFRMDSDLNAFGAYSVQHNPDAAPLELGARACATDLTVDLLKGPYFVRLILDKPVPDSRESLIRFATYMAAKIPGSISLPPALSIFPAENRVANSEVYLAPGVRDWSSLKGGFRVLYDVNGKKFTMFLTATTSTDDAIFTMSLFRDSFANVGGADPILPGPWMQAFWGLDRELGRAFVFQKGAYIGGTMGLPDQKLADKLSRQLANSLP